MKFNQSEKKLEGSVLRDRCIRLLIYVALLTHWAACALYFASFDSDWFV